MTDNVHLHRLRSHTFTTFLFTSKNSLEEEDVSPTQKVNVEELFEKWSNYTIKILSMFCISICSCHFWYSHIVWLDLWVVSHLEELEVVVDIISNYLTSKIYAHCIVSVYLGTLCIEQVCDNICLPQCYLNSSETNTFTYNLEYSMWNHKILWFDFQEELAIISTP